jgi:hypothetical protein
VEWPYRRLVKNEERTFGPRGWLGLPLFALSVFVIARTLAAFAAIIHDHLRVHYDYRLELCLVTGQVLFQWLWMWKHTWSARLSYGWILIAVSSAGAVMLWPMLALGLSPLPATIWFFGVVLVMFILHACLVVRTRLPTWLCATWVLYRLFLLAGVLKIPS